jgi:hypothetical protein
MGLEGRHQAVAHPVGQLPLGRQLAEHLDGGTELLDLPGAVGAARRMRLEALTSMLVKGIVKIGGDVFHQLVAREPLHDVDRLTSLNDEPFNLF